GIPRMSPPAKIRKIDPSGVKKRPPDGLIRFEIDKISTLDSSGRNSPSIDAKGLPWYVAGCKMRGKTTNRLCVYLYCSNAQSKQWRVDVDAEFNLVHSDNTNCDVVEGSATIHDEMESIGVVLRRWETLMDEERGFVKDDKVTIEIRFWIYNMIGIRVDPRMNFIDPSEPTHDVALIIDGEKIYVNKGILAIHSPFFKTMFYGD
ncbi:hypothetical protein PMAYCL1PPCAC_24884, partial [Pristionchus mayeri]